MVEQMLRLTGLQQFGNYLMLLFEVDMMFGNEGRHWSFMPKRLMHILLTG